MQRPATGEAHGAATAHLILKCRTGLESSIVENLRKIGEVKEIKRTIGEYDMLVKIESDNPDSLRRLVRWKIMKNDGILSAIILMCMRKSLCAVMEGNPTCQTLR